MLTLGEDALDELFGAVVLGLRARSGEATELTGKHTPPFDA
jgi:hypothetical protein